MRQPPRILIVDDEPDMCWALKSALQIYNYSVATATRGTEGLELITTERFAVAFVDAKLPDLDGLELAALIRQKSPQTAVILISGYFYPEDGVISRGLKKGLLFGFLAKPLELGEVRAIARRAVEAGEGGDQYNDTNSPS
ncbi:MAG: hypothetical protein A2Y73_07405 [Chloroflexi bacterium RBG_13_56_8]|nr:MAG: hypothetical protein A2Y73_07405 [Chloroflexi bacterium RBG_13_56_8]